MFGNYFLIYNKININFLDILYECDINYTKIKMLHELSEVTSYLSSLILY